MPRNDQVSSLVRRTKGLIHTLAKGINRLLTAAQLLPSTSLPKSCKIKIAKQRIQRWCRSSFLSKACCWGLLRPMAMMLPMEILLLIWMFLSLHVVTSLVATHPQPHPSLLFGVCSIPGTDPDRPQKVNQDRALRCQQQDHGIIGVLDGHGRKGHVVTDYLQQQLPRRIEQQLRGDSDDDDTAAVLVAQQTRDLVALGGAHLQRDLQHYTSTGQALIDAFLLAHLDARRADGIPTGRSGTTAVVCCIETTTTTQQRWKVTTAAVGDSRAFVLPLHNRTKPLEWLLPTTTTANPVERARIERCGQGRIDPSGNVFYGPVGIAMTRSLGNAVMLRAGVLPVPILSVWEWPNDTEYIVGCCTDGISDVLTGDVLAGLIRTGVAEREDGDLDQVAQRICHSARQAWLADLPIETKVDDCTITLAKLPYLR